MFIAAALQYPLPECNRARRGGNRMSTISVAQHKNKFDQVVVYCELAEFNEVATAWAAQGNVGEPTLDFTMRCRHHDACVYRNAYRKMLALVVPDYVDSILSMASYRYLLFDTKEALDAWLNENNGTIDAWCITWNAASADEFRNRLHEVYDACP